MYYATYVAFEIPISMAVKGFGTNHVLGIIVCGWALTTIFTCFVQNYHGAIATRLALGLCEAGLFPSVSFYISSIWTREEQAKRSKPQVSCAERFLTFLVASLYGAICFSGAFGGLLAYAIQLMGERAGLAACKDIVH